MIRMAKEAESTRPYTFRPYFKDDVNFIHSSWGQAYYYGDNYHDLLSPDEFHYYHRPIRERFFNRPTAAVIVCASKEDDSLILGWIAVERPLESRGIILHFVYVKAAFKGEGIFQGLLSRALRESPVMYTHLTDRGSKILRPRRPTDPAATEADFQRYEKAKENAKKKYKDFVHTPLLV